MNDDAVRSIIDTVFAQKDAEIKLLRDALLWCGGSADFQIGGQARIGWEKIVLPLLNETSR